MKIFVNLSIYIAMDFAGAAEPARLVRREVHNMDFKNAWRLKDAIERRSMLG